MKALAEKKAGRAPRYGPDHFPAVNWGLTLLRASTVGRRRRYTRQRHTFSEIAERERSESGSAEKEKANRS